MQQKELLSDRANGLSPSLTIAITTLALDLKAKGEDILSFSAGEPDFDTPKAIKDAAKKAIDEGFTKYTAIPGIVELREAIAGKLKRENALDYKPADIIASTGAKQSLFNLFQCILQKGDEVIIPSPYWVTYPEVVKFCGAKPIIVDTGEESGFKLTAQQLEDAITEKTKMIVLTSPSNPTGSLYSKEELEGLAKVLLGTNIIVVADEMYEKLIYDVDFTAAASISEDMFQRTVTVNGLSKSVAMTGWRFGYLASPNKELIAAMNRLQSQSTSNMCSITQKAAIPALNGSVDDEIEKMRVEFQKRRDIAYELFNQSDKLSVLKPDGAFYLFVNIKKVTGDSMEFCERLLKEEKVAVVPGLGFGSDGYFRFSFATSEENIRKGIEKIIKFCDNY